jgi:hypothetical protein
LGGYSCGFLVYRSTRQQKTSQFLGDGTWVGRLTKTGDSEKVLVLEYKKAVANFVQRELLWRLVRP